MTHLTCHPVDAGRLSDLDRLFNTSKTTAGCRCLWFIVSAKQCHADWGESNRVAFDELARDAPEPVGVLAYRGDEPVGWCAAGPWARFARALRSPLVRNREPVVRDRGGGDDDVVWLVPCFYVRRDARKAGITRALLDAAVSLARDRGAAAVEGFPLAGGARRSAADAYLGVEPLFEACGFAPVARLSANRVLMRRTL
jgi:GNAT superfamily N-acetyltransferase